MLLAVGADATAIHKDWGTALHRVAQDGPDDSDLAGLLMGAGCDPAQVDPYGETALENAKDHNRPSIAALLAAAAADPEGTLAPFRAEVAALRQLVAELGVEQGLATIEAEIAARAAETERQRREAVDKATQAAHL